MRIGLDTRYIYDHFPGIGRFFYHMIDALINLDSHHTFVLLMNPTLPNTRYDMQQWCGTPRVECINTTARPFSPAEHIQIPMLARSLHMDVLHSPYYVKPYIGLPCPSIVTIFDMIGRVFPETLSPRSRHIYMLLHWLAIHTATHIITSSVHSQHDMTRFFGVASERITVTPGATDAQFHPQTPQHIQHTLRALDLPQRYILYIGSNKPHKNLARLVDAWTRINTPNDIYLVIAGHYDPRYTYAQERVEYYGKRCNVRFVANVASDDLPALYSGALCFVFPSYYEGFGLPPLEAMACGTPVACANESSLPEVTGNAALMFNPYSVNDIANTLQRIIDDEPLRMTLRERGLQQAAMFTWQRTAAATLAVYESIHVG